jgi:hypothetical protein
LRAKDDILKVEWPFFTDTPKKLARWRENILYHMKPEIDAGYRPERNRTITRLELWSEYPNDPESFKWGIPEEKTA